MLVITGKWQRKEATRKPGRSAFTAASVLLSFLLSLLSTLFATGRATAEENLLVRIDRRDGEKLEYVAAPGITLRYCAPGWAIAEIAESDVENLRAAGVSFEVIDTVRTGTRYWLLLPTESSLDSLATYGKLFCLDDSGLYLFGLDETLEPRLVPFVHSQMPLPEKAQCRTFVPGAAPPRLGPGTRTPGLSKTDARKFLSSVSSEVSEDSIRATVDFLSFDDSLGTLRSRYTYRTDPVATPNWVLIPAWLIQKLQNYFAGRGVASLDTFAFSGHDTVYTRYNVVGRIPGRVPGSGTLVLCAHYDCSGGRTPGWQWWLDPAPGADDNASGVASVLECARVLSSLEFDFDIEFVLFAAEEQGLLGSAAYVQTKEDQGANILGALNFDMLAYRDVADSTFLRTNPFSDWLTSHIRDVSDALFDSIGIRVGRVPVPGPFDSSDHASFWILGHDAVHFFEQGSGFPVLNPYYHTVSDIAGTLNYPLALKVTQLAAASVAYFSNTTRPWDVQVVAGDLEFRLEGQSALISEADVGDVVSITPSFHNMGTGVYDTVSVYVSIYDGAPSTGALVGQRLVRGPLPSGWGPVIEPITWLLSEEDVGTHSIYLMIDAGDGELNTANNTVSKTLVVSSTQLAIKHSFVFPNPSRVSLRDTKLRVFVTRNAVLTSADVFDVSGRRIGGCGNGECGQISLSAGDNDISLNEILPAGALGSGVYVYRVRVEDETQERVSSGRFAVIR